MVTPEPMIQPLRRRRDYGEEDVPMDLDSEIEYRLKESKINIAKELVKVAKGRRFRGNLIATWITADGKKMSVFDFDDTLVSSESTIEVKHSNGELTALDSAAFAYYQEKGGDNINFTDFNHVTKPRIVKKNMDALKEAVKAGDKVVILTARPKGSASAVKKFLGSLGVNGVDVVALESGNPIKKAEWIQKNCGDSDVEFTDDSSKNTGAVDTLSGKIKGKLKTNNTPHPQEGDYDGPAINDIFHSDDNVPSGKKVEGPSPSDWWKDQSNEFKRIYCRNHPNSKYC
jgi:hypothetical protein